MGQLKLKSDRNRFGWQGLADNSLRPTGLGVEPPLAQFVIVIGVEKKDMDGYRLPFVLETQL